MPAESVPAAGERPAPASIWRIRFGQHLEQRVPGPPDPRAVEYIRADLAAVPPRDELPMLAYHFCERIAKHVSPGEYIVTTKDVYEANEAWLELDAHYAALAAARPTEAGEPWPSRDKLRPWLVAAIAAQIGGPVWRTTAGEVADAMLEVYPPYPVRAPQPERPSP